MTRLGYLLPFLWTLGYSTTLTTNPTTITTDKPVGNVYTTTQSITSVNTVDSTVSHSNPSVASSTDATSAKITTSTANLPSVSPETNKLTTISDQQRTTQPTTAKPDIKPVEVTSTRKSSITDTTPTVKPNDNATQPTDLTKGSTQVLISSPQAVTAPPSTMTKTTNLTTQLAATSPASLRTSQPSNVTDIRKTEVSSVSTVSLSPAIIYKTTRRNPDSTTSLVKNSTPMTTPPMIPKQKYIENIEFNCTAEHGESLVTIDVKSSSICGDYTSKDEDYVKKILQHICTALKPGYQPNKDRCHIDLGRRFPDGLAILDAYVHNSLPKKDLYAALKHIKKDQDGAYLFTYDGQKYEEEDLVSIPLISAIVALAVALLIAAAIYGCWHQRQTRKREQRLTEELQTMENGYHDNPTLEVMETSPEMQEKKGGPNGELGDSWIVPLDNLTREDFDDEEDTHL